MALLESHEIASFVVGFAVEPAPMKDADPLEGERTKRCLMGAATFAIALVEGLVGEHRNPRRIGEELAYGIGAVHHSPVKIWAWSSGPV